MFKDDNSVCLLPVDGSSFWICGAAACPHHNTCIFFKYFNNVWQRRSSDPKFCCLHELFLLNILSYLPLHSHFIRAFFFFFSLKTNFCVFHNLYIWGVCFLQEYRSGLVDVQEWQLRPSFFSWCHLWMVVKAECCVLLYSYQALFHLCDLPALTRLIHINSWI